jgi:hypothetical protein
MGVCVSKYSFPKAKQAKYVDCYTKGDPCEGPTCELGEVCLADSDLEGYCMPKEC